LGKREEGKKERREEETKKKCSRDKKKCIKFGLHKRIFVKKKREKNEIGGPIQRWHISLCWQKEEKRKKRGRREEKHLKKILGIKSDLHK
jgi:hypothetical protein